MKAARLHKYDPAVHGPEFLKLVEVPDPKVQDADDVIVRIGERGSAEPTCTSSRASGAARSAFSFPTRRDTRMLAGWRTSGRRCATSRGAMP